MSQHIACPSCGTSISIDEVLSHQIEDRIKGEFQKKQQAKDLELSQKEEALKRQTQDLVAQKKEMEILVQEKVSSQLSTEKIKIYNEAKVTLEREQSDKLLFLQEQLKSQNDKLNKASQTEIELRKGLLSVEEDKRAFELEKMQQLEEERKALAAKEDDLKKRSHDLLTQKESMETVVREQVLTQVSSERQKIYNEAKVSLEREQNERLGFLQEQLKEQNEKLTKATQIEIELRKGLVKLEADKQSFELDKMRQLDEERKVLTQEARQKATDEFQYKIDQVNKQLGDAIKAKDELARKLEQGSQQAQGEILEIALEEILKVEFPYDEILPVPKGMNGADIIQKVNDKSGRSCGQIVWETKRTKAWSEGWIQKLKDDQRAVKADLAVIVSLALPEDVKGFCYRDGVWICDIKLIAALAMALRINLTSIAQEKLMSIGKNDKMELLYSYLTGVEFRQRVEAIIEAFSSMNTSLTKERAAFEKIWAERQKQLEKVMKNTIGMYGDLSGLVTLQQIKTLEIGQE